MWCSLSTPELLEEEQVEEDPHEQREWMERCQQDLKTKREHQPWVNYRHIHKCIRKVIRSYVRTYIQ